MSDADQVFLSYSRNDPEAAASLRLQLEQHGLAVFKDDQSIREGDLWLNRLQEAVDACRGFVLLVGRDGVSRWIGAETQTALIRHFGPHGDDMRLPIFPILLGDTRPETLPAFLRLFQATPWNGRAPLPEGLLDQIRARSVVASEAAVFEGCPYVGLDAFRIDQSRLFFGRQKETLEALACFDTRRGFPPVRWLEINGNSGSGKSSLMNAGLLPLVDQGWLWPRTGTARWLRIGPLMPGQHPVGMLAESLVRFSRETLEESAEMASIRPLLEADDRGLADWLRSRKQEDTAFLLAVDQFEELFTFADPDERKHFDGLLATALADADCPLFLISTVRLDFLDRFEDLPRLVAVRNRYGRAWTLPPIGEDGLREVIDGPARIARLDVSEIRETLIDQAREEPGALPLVENALHWLWEQRKDNRLRGKLLTDHGGLAGILSESADSLLQGLEAGGDAIKPRRPWERLMHCKGFQRWVARLRPWFRRSSPVQHALALLFRLVNVDPEGRRHTRRRIPLAEAVALAGGGEPGTKLVNHLAGGRGLAKAQRSLRLITITGETARRDSGPNQDRDGNRTDNTPNPVGSPGNERKQELWVNLIHETLIRCKGVDEKGVPQGYWPTLWNYIEANKELAMLRELLELQAREWKIRRGLKRLSELASWRDLGRFHGMCISRQSDAGRYLAWSRWKAAVLLLVLTLLTAFIGESYLWTRSNDLPLDAMLMQQRFRLKYAPLPELIPISPGSFDMGEQDQGFLNSYSKEDWSYFGVPGKHIVIEESFFMGRYEVTYEEFDYYVWEQQREGRSDLKYPLTAKGGRGWHPVVNVTWDEAIAYTQWLGKRNKLNCRLPTEAEWEYAARAGNGMAYPWGNEVRRERLGKEEVMANCRGCGSPWDGEQSAPVGQFTANAFGLYDTSGNVWEWTCSSWSEQFDGNEMGCAEGEASGRRVLRGGSWLNDLDLARSAYRFRNYPDYRFNLIGFRVLCSSPIIGH